MESSPTIGLLRIEIISYSVNKSLPAIARGSSSVICVSFAVHCKCYSGLGEGGRRDEKANASILHLQSIGPIKKKLYKNGEGYVYSPNGLQEASALFRIPQHHHTFITTLERHYKKQRSFGADWKMGY
jgi:hypothetical protein